MTVVKYGVKLPFTFEAFLETPEPRGHYEPYTMTDEEVRERKKVKQAIKFLERSEWAYFDRDGGYYVRPKKTKEWVSDG